MPNETCSVVPPEAVSHDTTTADSDVRGVWVSELLQSVADVSLFSLKDGVLSDDLGGNDGGSLPACGRRRDVFPLPPLFELVLPGLAWTPRAAELAYARASVNGMNYLYAVAPSTSTTLLVTQRSILVKGTAHV